LHAAASGGFASVGLMANDEQSKVAPSVFTFSFHIKRCKFHLLNLILIFFVCSLHVQISRESIDACKKDFRDHLQKSDWQLMVELKKLFQILAALFFSVSEHRRIQMEHYPVLFSFA